MSATSRRVLLIASLAFALRAGLALALPRLPLESYHFNDARLSATMAREARARVDAGLPPLWGGPPGQRLTTRFAAAAFSLAGDRPIVLGLLVSVFSAIWVAALWALTRNLSGERAAIAVACFAALWPSAAFYGSQYLKDPVIIAAFTTGLAAALAARGWTAAAAAPFFLLAGTLRPMILLPAALCLSVAAAARRRLGQGGWMPPLALAFALLPAHRLLVVPLIDRIAPLSVASEDPTLGHGVVPAILETDGKGVSWALSPRGISAYRDYRQRHDQIWSIHRVGRRVETQIHPNHELETWLDLALFVPRAAFTVLFQPLPGLYPLEGKPLRVLASLENAALLAVFALFLSAHRRVLDAPDAAALAAAFWSCLLGSAVIEYDLGSASRHKILFAALMLPLAAGEVDRLRSRRPA